MGLKDNQGYGSSPQTNSKVHLLKMMSTKLNEYQEVKLMPA